jgi:hypothetical protein
MTLDKRRSSIYGATVVAVSLFLLSAFAPAAIASSPVTLISPNAMKGGEFGISVGVNNTVAVGAPLENASGTKLAKGGNAYTFNLATGAHILTLTSPNEMAGGEFGFFVVMSDFLVASAQHETVSGHTQAGRVYVFNPSSGALLRTLQSPNVQTSGAFGSSIDSYGNYVAVGAAGETVAGKAAAGRVYLFNAETNKLLHTFASPNFQVKGAFGTWVALSNITKSNNYLVVGAVGETVNGLASAGRVYVFNAVSPYNLITTLVSPNVQANAKFGWELGIRHGLVLATAPFETVGTLADEGHAYVFNPTTGALIYTLTSTNPKKSGEFGFSATEDAGYFVVGAPGETKGGEVYTFSTSTGKLVGTPLNNSGGGSFGDSVAVLGTVVVVGAPKQSVKVGTTSFSTAGKAFIF